MPRTLGAFIHLDEIDCIVECDGPSSAPAARHGDLEKAIGEHVAKLIGTGSPCSSASVPCPDAVLLFLKGTRRTWASTPRCSPTGSLTWSRPA